MVVMRSLAFVLCVAAAAAGCGIADFDVDQPVPEQMIQGSGIPGPLAALFPLPLNLDLTQQIKAHDTGPIDSVTMSSLTLTITATDVPQGDTDDWSFVDQVDVYIESTKSGTTLPRAKIASISHPGAVQTMTFVVDHSVNLEPYINEGTKVDTQGSGTAPPDDVSYDGKSTFRVHPL
jgi:hypothetical protein